MEMVPVKPNLVENIQLGSEKQGQAFFYHWNSLPSLPLALGDENGLRVKKHTRFITNAPKLLSFTIVQKNILLVYRTSSMQFCKS